MPAGPRLRLLNLLHSRRYCSMRAKGGRPRQTVRGGQPGGQGRGQGRERAKGQASPRVSGSSCDSGGIEEEDDEHEDKDDDDEEEGEEEEEDDAIDGDDEGDEEDGGDNNADDDGGTAEGHDEEEAVVQVEVEVKTKCVASAEGGRQREAATQTDHVTCPRDHLEEQEQMAALRPNQQLADFEGQRGESRGESWGESRVGKTMPFRHRDDTTVRWRLERELREILTRADLSPHYAAPLVGEGVTAQALFIGPPHLFSEMAQRAGMTLVDLARPSFPVPLLHHPPPSPLPHPPLPPPSPRSPPSRPLSPAPQHDQLSAARLT